MKKSTIFMLFMIMAAACAALIGYRVMDRVATDTTRPEIIMDSQEISLSVSDPGAALLQGVTARDDRDGDVTASLVVESIYGIGEDHRATVVYAAFDSSANVTKAQRQVCYTDYESPRFTMSGPLVFTYGRSFDVFDVISAQDQFDGDISNRIKATLVSDSSSLSDEGSHEVQFRVTNSLGDTVQLVLPVEVAPGGTYNATLNLSDYLVYLPKGSSFNRQSYLEKFETQNTKLDLSGALPEGVSVSYEGNVDTNTPGVYMVAYTVTYTQNNWAYTAYSRLLVVVEE